MLVQHVVPVNPVSVEIFHWICGDYELLIDEEKSGHHQSQKGLSQAPMNI